MRSQNSRWITFLSLGALTAMGLASCGRTSDQVRAMTSANSTRLPQAGTAQNVLPTAESYRILSAECMKDYTQINFETSTTAAGDYRIQLIPPGKTASSPISYIDVRCSKPREYCQAYESGTNKALWNVWIESQEDEGQKKRSFHVGDNRVQGVDGATQNWQQATSLGYRPVITVITSGTTSTTGLGGTTYQAGRSSYTVPECTLTLN